MQQTNFNLQDINTWMTSRSLPILSHGGKIADLVTRPEVTINHLSKVIPPLKELISTFGVRAAEIVESAEINIKYRGYIDRERLAADKLQRLDSIRIPHQFDYNSIQSLSTEARQKLSRIQPESIGQASRIPGVSPNDISVLLVLMGR